MKTFAFFNVKGGVGKTTTATSVAHLLAQEHNKKVLLVDLDPQSNTSSLFATDDVDILNLVTEVFGNNNLDCLKNYEHTVGDLLINSTKDVSECIYKTQYKNLDLLPSFITLAEIEEQMKADIRTPQQFRLKQHLEKIKNNYDYCILDLSPSINIININGLTMTDYVFTPLRADKWGFSGYCIANNLVKTVSSYNPKLQIGGCFFVQWSPRSNLSKQIRELMTALLKDKFIDIQIRKCIKVEEMTYEHRALADYAKSATATQDYRALTAYIYENF